MPARAPVPVAAAGPVNQDHARAACGRHARGSSAEAASGVSA